MPPSREYDRYKDKKYIRNKLRTLFETAQEQSGHQAIADKCKKLYQKCGETSIFLDEFTTCLRYCFVYSEKNAVERMLSFASKFIVTLYCRNNENIADSLDEEEEEIENEDPLATGILGFLFKSHSAASVDARLRCITLLNKILSSMPENSTISDEMWSKLSETVLSRIQDRSPVVRAQAVLTARKLQNPKNADCEIMQALVFHLNDPSSAVRRVVVSSIALNKTTIGYVLARTRDVNDNVRRNAYLVFSKVKVLNLTIKYRTTILERGLQDRSEMVRECVRKLVVVHWLENFNNDVLKFLEALDVVNGADVGILVLDAIFKTVPMADLLKILPLAEETKLIPRDALTPETALLWRSLVQFFHKEQREDELEEILPNLTTFCDYIKDFYPLEKISDSELSEDEQWEEVKQKQILLHLIHMAKVFDFSDEMGRINLKKLITSMLTSFRISPNISDSLIELMALIEPSSETFMQEITEAISEVKEPLNQIAEPMPRHKKMELELKISDLKVTLNDLKEREYNAVQNKEYAVAQNLKDEMEDIANQLEELQSQPVTVPNEVREERNDPVTLCKCLSMLIQMIKFSNVRSLTPTLRSLKDNFLNQCLTSHDLLTQSLAIQALGQFCILDKELAKENLFRFMLMVSENGDNEINIPALKCIFDIIHVYGIESFENLDETQDLSNSRSKSRTLLIENEDFLNESLHEIQPDATLSGAKCISMLKELLNCKSNEGIKMVVYEGLCKLLLSGVVYSSSVLSKIIVKGFSPIINSESEDFICQVFIMFFPIFAANTPRSQEMIEAAFMPALKIIANASLGSPEADINPKDVLNFLIEHTKPDINKYASKTLHVHNNLAISICNEILHDTFEDQNMILIFLKALLQLEISSDESFVQQLKTLQAKLEDKCDYSPGLLRCIKDLGRKLDEKAQTTLQSVENTLATTNSDGRSSKGTEDTTNPTTGSMDFVNSTAATRATRNSSVSTVSTIRTTRSSKRRRTTQNDLSSVNETLESTQISESNESFSTPGSNCGRQKGGTGKIVPESPEVSDESS